MLLEKKDIPNVLEKKKSSKFERIGWLQMISLWNKESREYWRKNFLINNLIKQRDFSTLFELKKNGYELSQKQELKLNESINNTLLDRSYPEKYNIFHLMKSYNVNITNENYYHYMISNTFTKLVKKYNENDIGDKAKEFLSNILSLLDNQEFKKGFHDFILTDIINSPQDFGGSLRWSMNRDLYYCPLENEHIFSGMTKTQYQKIIKTGIGTEHLLNEYRALAMKAPIDLDILEGLGINTQSIIEKAQKSLLLKEESLTEEMKELINQISIEISKYQKQNDQQYLEEVGKIVEEILPNVVKKYLSIDEEYRVSLRNVEGKLPSELLLESLSNLNARVKNINQTINQEKVSHLSIDNRKLKNINKM